MKGGEIAPAALTLGSIINEVVVYSATLGIFTITIQIIPKCLSAPMIAFSFSGGHCSCLFPWTLGLL